MKCYGILRKLETALAGQTNKELNKVARTEEHDGLWISENMAVNGVGWKNKIQKADPKLME